MTPSRRWLSELSKLHVLLIMMEDWMAQLEEKPDSKLLPRLIANLQQHAISVCSR